MSDIIMHIDVNSAFLSWTAAYEQQIGLKRDIREVASVIGGNEENRHGIVFDKVIDTIREKYGDNAIIRGVFANSELSPLLGGYPEDDYPAMSSIL